MFPNCYLSSAGFNSVMAMFIIICALIAIAALVVMKGRKRMPLRICQYVVASMAIQIGHLVSVWVEGKPGIVAEIFMILIISIGAVIGPFLLVWTLASPALELMMLHDQMRMSQLRLRLIFAIMLIDLVVVYSVALYFQYQGDYYRFNYILAWEYIFISMYGVGLNIGLFCYSRLLFTQMDRIIGASSDSKNPKFSKEEGNGTMMPSSSNPSVKSKVARHREKLGR